MITTNTAIIIIKMFRLKPFDLDEWTKLEVTVILGEVDVFVEEILVVEKFTDDVGDFVVTGDGVGWFVCEEIVGIKVGEALVNDVPVDETEVGEPVVTEAVVGEDVEGEVVVEEEVVVVVEVEVVVVVEVEVVGEVGAVGELVGDSVGLKLGNLYDSQKVFEEEHW